MYILYVVCADIIVAEKCKGHIRTWCECLQLYCNTFPKVRVGTLLQTNNNRTEPNLQVHTSLVGHHTY